jgi:hypothetical protein
MAEPTSSGAGGAALVAIAVSLVGTKYGPVLTVGAAALVGAFISLGEVANTATRMAALWYVVRYTLAACLVSGSISYLLEQQLHLPAIELIVLVAFSIGWVGGRWKALLESLLSAGQRVLAARTNGPPPAT